MSAGPTRIELLAFAALLAMTAAWGSTFFMIKDIVTRHGSRRPAGRAVPDRRSGPDPDRRPPAADEPARPCCAASSSARIYGVAQILQTLGLARTSASVSGFITGLYVVATPLLAALLLRTRIPRLTWLAAGAGHRRARRALAERLLDRLGELLTLVSAVVYAGHIIALGRVAGPAPRWA